VLCQFPHHVRLEVPFVDLSKQVEVLVDHGSRELQDLLKNVVINHLELLEALLGDELLEVLEQGDRACSFRQTERVVGVSDEVRLSVTHLEYFFEVIDLIVLTNEVEQVLSSHLFVFYLYKGVLQLVQPHLVEFLFHLACGEHLVQAVEEQTRSWKAQDFR